MLSRSNLSEAVDSRSEVTHLLQEWAAGDRKALDRLMPLVYEELRRLAQRRLGRERADHTLSTTELVHEAYLRLVDVEPVGFRSREQFLALAAQAMRRLLVDHARRRGAARRGGSAKPVPLDDVLNLADEDAARFLELDAALQRLESVGTRQARILEQHYFAGLSVDEIATAMELSSSTVKRDLRFGRAWLATELSA